MRLIDQSVASCTARMKSDVTGDVPERIFEIIGALTSKNRAKYASDGSLNSCLIASRSGCGAVFALFPILLLLKVVY
jgi:hypothetical protein